MTRRALLLLLMLCGCQRQPAPPQDAPDTLQVWGTDSIFYSPTRINTRPDTLTRKAGGAHAPQPVQQVRQGLRTPRHDVAAAGPVALDGWTPPPAGPHNLDTLRFIAPTRDAIPGSCAVDSSHFLTDSVWVWVERRYPTAPPWAPWHTAWHLVRRIRLAPGQPCTLNTARPAWHRFSVRDRAGNVSCADSIYRGAR